MINSTNSDCIENCSNCHDVCLRTAMNHCLRVGGKHIEPEHFKLMMDCAKMCATSADFQLSNSVFAPQVCGVCAKICTACADSCEEVGDMDECVAACRKCAESCKEMAA